MRISPSRAGLRIRAGFTLVEMVAVMGIAAILFVVLAPSLSQVFQGSALTQAQGLVAGLLSYARQSAITQNETMEVRIYQFADPTYPGETAGSAGSGKYRAFQIFKIDPTGAGTVWAPMQRLPAGIIVDSGITLSSLMQASFAKNWTTLDPKVSLPLLGTSYNCAAFQLRADGSTNLPVSPPTPPGTWCFTLHNIKNGDALAAPPANFVTLQIDPLNGNVAMFHP